MKTEIITPSTPNFVKVRVGTKEEVTMPIHELSEEQIRDLGARWTSDLLISAKRRKLSNIG